MDTCEFDITFPADCIWDVVHELGDYFGIPIDDEAFDVVYYNTERRRSAKNIAAFYDPQNRKNLIVACCFNDDELNGVTMRCDSSCADKVKAKMLEIDTRIRKTGYQELQTDLEDLSQLPNDGLKYLESQFGLRFDD